MKELDELTRLLYGPGERMTGSGMSNEQARAYGYEHFSHFQYCLIRDWIWVDLEVTEAQLIELNKHSRRPVLIYARTVIYDSARRWDVGDFVRTSPLYSFEDGFLFKTTNSVYILLGDGVRKCAKPETVGRIF
jgi:hypothetical protein